jgi:hypothetical protein
MDEDFDMIHESEFEYIEEMSNDKYNNIEFQENPFVKFSGNKFYVVDSWNG